MKQKVKQNLLDKTALLRISSIIIIIALSFLGYSFLGLFSKKSDLEKELSDTRSKIQNLEQRNNQISQFLDNANNENYLEKEARLKLNLQKPGEKVVIILQDKNNEQANVHQENKLRGFFDWWQKLIGR